MSLLTTLVFLVGLLLPSAGPQSSVTTFILPNPPPAANPLFLGLVLALIILPPPICILIPFSGSLEPILELLFGLELLCFFLVVAVVDKLEPDAAEDNKGLLPIGPADLCIVSLKDNCDCLIGEFTFDNEIELNEEFNEVKAGLVLIGELGCGLDIIVSLT